MKDNKKIITELFRLGELPEGWEDKVDRETIDDDVSELLSSDRDILERYRPSRMAAEIGEKVRSNRAGRKKNRVRTVVAYTAAAAAMLVMGLILPGIMTESTGFDPAGTTRIKGKAEAGLTLYRNTGLSTEVLDENSTAREGDLIQLGYSVSAEMPYGIILSIDGRGIVTRHLAPEGQLAEKLVPGGEHLLDFAYELDDAPLFETFYLLVSDRPFPVDPVLDMLSREARGEGNIIDIPEIIGKSSLDSRGIGKMVQFAVSIPKED